MTLEEIRAFNLAQGDPVDGLFSLEDALAGLAELLPEDDALPHLVAAVQWPYKLVCEVRTDGLLPIALYDVRSDPGERIDLARDPSHAVARDALREWLAGRLAVGVTSSESDEIDASLRRWLIEMGYLQDGR